MKKTTILKLAQSSNHIQYITRSGQKNHKIVEPRLNQTEPTAWFSLGKKNYGLKYCQISRFCSDCGLKKIIILN